MKNDSDNLLSTRVSLLNRLKNWSDQDSWRDFFDTYWKLIYGAAVRSGLNDAEAQDVVQETLIVVAKKMATFTYDPAVDSFKGWLFYVTRKCIAMRYRRRERERRGQGNASDEVNFPADIELLPDPAGVNLEAAWDVEWKQTLLDAALVRVKSQVNPKQFQMFSLYVMKQKPVKEVAQMLNVPVAQVYLAKHRISTLVKTEIEHLESKMI